MPSKESRAKSRDAKPLAPKPGAAAKAKAPPAPKSRKNSRAKVETQALPLEAPPVPPAERKSRVAKKPKARPEIETPASKPPSRSHLAAALEKPRAEPRTVEWRAAAKANGKGPKNSSAPLAAPRHGIGAPWTKGVFAKAVGSFVPALAKKAFEKHGFSTVALLTSWTDIVGAALARGTSPERLAWPQGRRLHEGDGPRPAATLVLSVDPSRALDIEYKASQIIDRINVYFGYRAVDRVRIEQAPDLAPREAPAFPPLTPRAIITEPPPEVAAIADVALRDALAKLSVSVMARAHR